MNANPAMGQLLAILDHITDKNKKIKFFKRFQKCTHLFRKDKFDVGRVNSRKAEINERLIFNSSRNCKCSILDENDIKIQIKKLLEAHLIQE